jgi:putative transposase
LTRCRTRYTTALQERKTAWERRGVAISSSQQQAEVPDLAVDVADYAAVHSQVLPDVRMRLERALHAFFHRVTHGQKPGSPRLQGSHRWHSLTSPQYGNGAVLDGEVLSLSKLGRLPNRLHRPLVGIPKTVTSSREADGWYACIACAEVPGAAAPTDWAPDGHRCGAARVS